MRRVTLGLTATAFAAATLLAAANPAPTAPTPAVVPKPTPAEEMTRAMARWNKLSEGTTVPGPGGGAVGFTWDADHFPHPTFKGGSAAAYGAFARLLVKFLDEPGSFDALAENDLFAARLRYVYAGGKDANVDWTLGKLVADLSEPKAHGDHDEATRKALKGYAEKITGGAKAGKP